MIARILQNARFSALALSLVALGACATPAPPPPPAPVVAPPPVQLVPYRPLPPMSAASMMVIPGIGADGTRQTINSGITTAQTVWNMRAALNVAALNCQEPQFANLLPNYSAFLTTFRRPLKTANDTTTREFRDRFGAREYRGEQDSYMTRVYNFYALPPAQRAFCQAALEVSAESLLVAPADLESFSARSLPKLNFVFEDFFRSYEQYQRDLANWNAAYGVNAVPGTPVTSVPRTGSLAPTAQEQVLFRETTDGISREAIVESQQGAATVEVLPQVDPGASAPEAGLQGELEPTPTIDGTTVPGFQTAPVPGTTATGPVAPVQVAPAPDAGGIVFTSDPVVQTEPGPEGE
ncbi:hypothetical protein OAS19_02275 [Altererythrobacter sp.]|nr:hypothetical protein [Altererythrobacter sp.]